MDISNINGISTGDIKSFFNNTSLTKTDKTDSFSDVLSAAMGSIGETNDLQNAAEQEEVRFALGESDNTHDLLVAETKAAVALQYTVAVRDKIIDAYNAAGSGCKAGDCRATGCCYNIHNFSNKSGYMSHHCRKA